jgi:hypothetical protein
LDHKVQLTNNVIASVGTEFSKSCQKELSLLEKE